MPLYLSKNAARPLYLSESAAMPLCLSKSATMPFCLSKSAVTLLCLSAKMWLYRSKKYRLVSLFVKSPSTPLCLPWRVKDYTTYIFLKMLQCFFCSKCSNSAYLIWIVVWSLSFSEVSNAIIFIVGIPVRKFTPGKSPLASPSFNAKPAMNFISSR